MEVLRLLVALASGFRRLLQPHLAGVLEAAWALFVACLPVYQQMVVVGCEDLEQDVRFFVKLHRMPSGHCLWPACPYANDC